MKKIEKALAYECGFQAFERGLPCAPCNDSKFMAIFVEQSKVLGGSVKAMKTWTKGWTDANLKAVI